MRCYIYSTSSSSSFQQFFLLFKTSAWELIPEKLLSKLVNILCETKVFRQCFKSLLKIVKKVFFSLIIFFLKFNCQSPFKIFCTFKLADFCMGQSQLTSFHLILNRVVRFYKPTIPLYQDPPSYFQDYMIGWSFQHIFYPCFEKNAEK